MAYLPVDTGYEHRFISRERLLALLLRAPPCSHIVVTRTGNLNIFSLYPNGRAVGYINLGDETYLNEEE